MNNYYVKKIAIIMLVLMILLLPIASMADTYSYDWSTETKIYLPSDWREVEIANDKSFSLHFTDDKRYDESYLSYLGANTAYVIPMAYRKTIVKSNSPISALILGVKTTSYPMEMYSQVFEVPQEYMSVVSINGIDYIRIDEYKTKESRGKQDSYGYYSYNDVVWYVCVIEYTVFIYRFHNQGQFATSVRSFASFEREKVSQYEQILGNVKYKHIEKMKTIGICAGVIILVAILIGIIRKVGKKKRNTDRINRLPENNHEGYAEDKHAHNVSESYQPPSQEPKTATDAPEQHTDNFSPIAINENEKIQYCRKCGNRLLPDSVFCDKCGTKVQ